MFLNTTHFHQIENYSLFPSSAQNEQNGMGNPEKLKIGYPQESAINLLSCKAIHERVGQIKIDEQIQILHT